MYLHVQLEENIERCKPIQTIECSLDCKPIQTIECSLDCKPIQTIECSLDKHFFFINYCQYFFFANAFRFTMKITKIIKKRLLLIY